MPFFTPEPTRIPGYLKTVPSPVVPSTNPDAPYGLDENGRPIGIYVGPSYVKPEQTGIVETPTGPCRCGSLLCKHCHPENIAQTDVVKVYEPVELTDEEKQQRDIAHARSFLGVGPQQAQQVQKPAVWFTEILGITRQGLLDLLDTEIGKENITVTDGTRLKETTLEKAQLTARTTALEHISGRIQETKEAIKASEALIASLSVHAMKHGMPGFEPRAKDDDVLTKKEVREQLKREERRVLDKLEVTLSGLRKQEKLVKDDISNIQRRLETWGARSEDYEKVGTTIQVGVTFRERFKEPTEPIKDESVAYSNLKLLGVTPTNSYVSLLSTEYEALRMLSRSHLLLRPWRRFENEVIRQAVAFGLLRPTEEQLRAHPSLKLPEESDVDEVDTDHPEEESLILKTGGAQIGASIYGSGYNRRQGSFDNAIAFGNKDKGGEASGDTGNKSEGWSSDVHSDDYGDESSS